MPHKNGSEKRRNQLRMQGHDRDQGIQDKRMRGIDKIYGLLDKGKQEVPNVTRMFAAEDKRKRKVRANYPKHAR